MKIFESWEAFEDGELQYFDARGQETLRSLWGSYLANIEKDMTELRFLRRVLQQRIEMFDTMRNGASLSTASIKEIALLTALACQRLYDG